MAGNTGSQGVPVLIVCTILLGEERIRAPENRSTPNQERLPTYAQTTMSLLCQEEKVDVGMRTYELHWSVKDLGAYRELCLKACEPQGLHISALHKCGAFAWFYIEPCVTENLGEITLIPS